MLATKYSNRTTIGNQERMDSTTHQAVRREDQRRRNAAARANRLRVAEVAIVRGQDDTGTEYVFATSRKEPDKGYRLTLFKGAWTCGCFVARWRGTCPHVEAVRSQEALEVADA